MSLLRRLLGSRRRAAVWAALPVTLCLAACEPEVGTRSWCESLRGKATQDWAAAEIEAYVERCLMGAGATEEPTP
jgi:hypothetical protein